jgi:putative oxidoreductase
LIFTITFWSHAMTAIRYVPFAGRLLIGLPFAISGLSKLGAIGPTLEAIRSAGLPFPPFALAISVAVEVAPAHSASTTVN